MNRLGVTRPGLKEPCFRSQQIALDAGPGVERERFDACYFFPLGDGESERLGASFRFGHRGLGCVHRVRDLQLGHREFTACGPQIRTRAPN